MRQESRMQEKYDWIYAIWGPEVDAIEWVEFCYFSLFLVEKYNRWEKKRLIWRRQAVRINITDGCHQSNNAPSNKCCLQLFLGLARIHSPKFSPSQQIPGQFMALRTSSSGCKGLMADFEYIWGQLAISVARRLWEAGLRGPDFARHWRASFKRRNATGIALFRELGWSQRIKTLLGICGRNEKSCSNEMRKRNGFLGGLHRKGNKCSGGE